MKVSVVFVLALCFHLSVCDPLIKVFCSGSPLFRGRLDSIVSPGVVSGHVHKVAGGSNFGPALASQKPIDVYNDMRKSPCTTCSINTVDLSAYWHPDLYYRWPNGSLSLVPKGGLTIYYFGRAGDGDQAHPAWKAFPPGFRMVSGNPFRRTYNASSVADQAINFACLSNPGGPETHDLGLTATRFCVNGLRLQVHFPQCWDGVNLDSPNHASHVAFPTRPDGGNCPPTHPVRIPDLFFEAFYTVSDFPHGPAPTGDGTQRFVLACGDSTGYGFHGDFLNGWDQNVLQAVFTDPSCDQTNTNNGNTVTNCAPVAQYVQQTPAGACTLNHKVPLTENLGFANTINTLPGCNAVTGAGATAPICSSPPSATEKAPATTRFHLKAPNGKYYTCPSDNTVPMTASQSNATGLTYAEVFVAKVVASPSWSSFQNEGPTAQFISASGTNSALMCNRGTVSDWEEFQFIQQSGGKVAILAKRNNQYVTANSDGTLAPSSTTIGANQLFTQEAPAGGSAF